MLLKVPTGHGGQVLPLPPGVDWYSPGEHACGFTWLSLGQMLPAGQTIHDGFP